MASIKIFEHEYQLAYTIGAQSEIAKRFGGLEKIELAFSGENVAKMMENMTFCAAVMCRAYEDRERVRAKALGDEYKGGTVLDESDIAAAIEPKDVFELSKAIMESMNEGNATTVEVEPAKGKNADATS